MYALVAWIRIPPDHVLLRGCCLQGFQEGKIHFAPTFKFVQGNHDYHTARVPSWTDRILWKLRSHQEALEAALSAELPPPPALHMEQLYYTSVPSVVSSDHKPVVAGFKLVLGARQEGSWGGLLDLDEVGPAAGAAGDPQLKGHFGWGSRSGVEAAAGKSCSIM